MGAGGGSGSKAGGKPKPAAERKTSNLISPKPRYAPGAYTLAASSSLAWPLVP